MEKPILMSTPMIKAILSGAKTVTRRVIKPQPTYCRFVESGIFTYPHPVAESDSWIYCPYGEVGNCLWVKETWQAYNLSGSSYSSLPKEKKAQAELYNWAVVSKATNPEDKRPRDPWIPSIFMPRWASAITLEITDVKVERIQEINNHEAWREGIPEFGNWIKNEGEARDEFARLWDSINLKRGYGWDANPWVWAISFKLTKP